MLTGDKTMEAPRHVLRTFFRDSSFPLVQHHLDSYNAMTETKIPTFIRASNPIQLELPGTDKQPGTRYIRVYIGGKNGVVSFKPPVNDQGRPIVPQECRLDNMTYAMTLVGDIEVEYAFSDGPSEVKKFENIDLGSIPLMLRSKNCYLTGLNGYDIGECIYELGGYFVIDGAEKVLLTQELLGNNMIYVGERERRASGGEKEPSVIDVEKKKAEEEGTTYNAKFGDLKEVYVGIRSISEDATKGPYSHFLVLPPENTYNDDYDSLGRDRRLAVITLPGFRDPVPLISLFRALGVSTDREIYDTILAGVPDRDRLAYDDLFQQIVLSHETHLKISGKNDTELLAANTKRKSRTEVIENIHELLLPHVEGGDIGVLFRRKAYLIGHMTRMAFDVTLKRKPVSDRDNIQFKRFVTSGDLCFQEFRRVYREMAKDMQLRMDSRIQYERETYKGRGITGLIERETVRNYWREWRMISEFSRSFKGQWGGRNGISQELNRISYIGYLSQLRRTSLQIDPSMNTAPPRRLYASQFGLMCPIDSPDGSSVGHLKSLAVLAKVSTSYPSNLIKQRILDTKLVLEISDVLPSTWMPHWTKIFINSDLFAVCPGKTETLHKILIDARRAGEFKTDVSLGWNRLENVYTIASDEGRPVRPVYREGIVSNQVLAAPSWDTVQKLMDYVDAQESDVSMFSITPFHSEHRSEIHMTFCMSPITNLVPFSDHNPGTRNNFAIAQQKQACSWYHTNYTKRFDTICAMTVNPQKPISQTWMYREIMGAGGCMPYGENALVAITTYGGHNQEDSVILNSNSLKRGMFRTMYFHSYDIQETMIDQSSHLQTVFGNPLTNAKYKESVKRKEDADYSQLDANGYIKVGSHVTDKTVLVGILSPVNTEGFRDVSELPKRGQHGRVDAVYTYKVKIGSEVVEQQRKDIYVSGVKIRIVEERSPVPGDKMASRHSQKGTCGMLMPEQDMPFTASGVRPDIIFNPHALPTRMTVGQFLESSCNRIGLQLGSFVDATPFTTSRRVSDLRELMILKGYEPYSSEILYNGLTGEMMEADIFMGPVYYQRLKHMVEDKINYRSTGPKTLMTHQPVHGRSRGGGLAIGEMEKDCMNSHGMSKFLHESFMDRSDVADIQINRETGILDTSRETMKMPYAMSLFVKELESSHIDIKLITK